MLGLIQLLVQTLRKYGLNLDVKCIKRQLGLVSETEPIQFILLVQIHYIEWTIHFPAFNK